MSRRQTDSDNWGGPRENSGPGPLFDEPYEMLRTTLPTRLIKKLRQKAKAGGGSVPKLLAKMLERMSE